MHDTLVVVSSVRVVRLLPGSDVEVVHLAGRHILRDNLDMVVSEVMELYGDMFANNTALTCQSECAHGSLRGCAAARVSPWSKTHLFIFDRPGVAGAVL